MATQLYPKKRCMCGLRHGCWLSPALLQLCFLLLASTGVIGQGTRVNSNSASASTAEAATAAAGAAATASLDMDATCLGLVQVAMTPSRMRNIREEEPIDAERTEEEAKEEKIEEEVSLQAGQQSVRRRSLFGTAELKLNRTAGNHSDTNTSRGRQPVSQSPVSNRSSAVDANRTAAFGPFLSNGSWLNMYIGFRQLSASLHPKIMVACQYIAAASMRTAFWTSLSLICFTVLVCVWLGWKGPRSNARTVTGTIRPPGEAPSGFLSQPKMSRRPSPFSNSNPMRPQTTPRLPSSMASVEPTSAVSLRPSPQARDESFLVGTTRALSLLSPPEVRDVLCPTLVVPPNCESLLHIHINNSTNSLHVSDVQRNTVMQVELQAGKTLLHSDGFILAKVVAKPVHGSTDEIQLLRTVCKSCSRWP